MPLIPSRVRWKAIRKAVALIAVLTGALPLGASPAWADLRLCNTTASRVGVALGYRDEKGWVTEGWWNLKPKKCETLVQGALAARFYYIYATDYDHGGDWPGKSFMCTKDRKFTIRGINDCLARGYDRKEFFEVDTGEQKNWTVQLTESGRLPARLPDNLRGNLPGSLK